MASYTFTTDGETEVKPIQDMVFTVQETQNVKLRKTWKHTIDHTSTPPKRITVETEE